MLNAISPFSPGNVPNSEDWFGRGGNMMKMLDVKMIGSVKTVSSSLSWLFYGHSVIAFLQRHEL
ncbi:MAG TPA: hypothetical protein VFS97_14210 [Nitrososphaeraceae archaeon]|nr:hypothetical protein [Nitrososphaeraceae archaeon]